MARTLNEINQELRTNFMANTTMQARYGFASGATFEDEFSIVSFEAILFFVIATSIWSLEQIFDTHKQWMIDKESTLKPWNLPTLVANAKKFQFGDALIFIGGQYRYLTENPAQQLVKLASANESGNTVVLKVATLNSSNLPEPLTTEQRTAFQAYIKQMKPPGVKMAVVSRPADSLKIFYTIYIDPLVLNTNGEMLSNTSVKPVEATITTFIQSLPFDGVFEVTKLTDAIQQTVGVRNPVFQSGEVKYGTLAYQSIPDFYVPNAGYLAIDPAFPLSVTIQYVIS
jgi:hypothetical protein